MEENSLKMEEKDGGIEKNRRIWFETEGRKIVNEIERRILFRNDMESGSKSAEMEKKDGQTPKIEIEYISPTTFHWFRHGKLYELTNPKERE